MKAYTAHAERALAVAALMGTLLLLPGCPNAGDPSDLIRSAGCQKDSDCKLVGEGMLCRKGSCVEKATTEKKAASKPKPKPKPAGPVADLTVRICPGYWNLSQNSGTLIARNRATSKKHYLRLGSLVQEGGLGKTFTFKGLAHGDYDVTYITGVIAGGQKDMMSVKCAVGTACFKEIVRRVTLAAPPATEEARTKAAEEVAALLKKQKLEQGPPCDFDINL